MKYDLRICNDSDVYEINQIMLQIVENIKDKELFVFDDLDFVKEHVNKKGFIVGAFYKEKLVGYLLVRIPGFDDDNLGYDLGFDEKKLLNVAHIESVGVRKKQRGNSLHKKMLKFAEDKLKADGIAYSLATVSPRNKYSLRNFIKNGYLIKLNKKKYSGIERAIILKKLLEW